MVNAFQDALTTPWACTATTNLKRAAVAMMGWAPNPADAVCLLLIADADGFTWPNEIDRCAIGDRDNLTTMRIYETQPSVFSGRWTAPRSGSPERPPRGQGPAGGLPQAGPL